MGHLRRRTTHKLAERITVHARALCHPTHVHFGRGDLPKDSAWPIPRPALLIVSAGGLQRLATHTKWPHLDGIAVFSAFSPCPTPEHVDACVAVARDLSARAIVGVGGGSSLDLARCVAVMAADPQPRRTVSDYRSTRAPRTRTIRLIQVPTTAGTGAELTCTASLWPRGGSKWSVETLAGYADGAYIDSRLADSMPRSLTAATGLDALVHAMEALWSVRHNAASDAAAIEAITLMGVHLLRAIDSPDAENRDAVMAASTCAGLALSHTQSAAAHALSYRLTSENGVPHGVAVGLMARALLPWHEQHAPLAVRRIAKALGGRTSGDASRFIGDVLEAAGFGTALSAYGVAPEHLVSLVDDALASARLRNSPGPPDRECLTEAVAAVA